MNPLLGALALVLIGLVGARITFSAARAPLGPRLIFSAGTHFLFLGFVLGPNVLGLLGPEAGGQLYPLLALGLGWIGLLFGMQLDVRQLRRFPAAFLAITLTQAILSFVIFLGIASAVLVLSLGFGPVERVIVLAAAATACVSTPAGIALISHAFLVRGRVSRLLLFAASLDAAVGILALQLVYASFHATAAGVAVLGWRGPAWLALAVALGGVLGLVFLWLTRPKPDPQELVLFLLGLVVLSAGAALFLGLSPLFVCATAGAVIANLSPQRRRVFAVLEAWEKPLYVILLTLAGALLQFATWVILPLAAGYFVIRGFAKIAAGFVATGLLSRAGRFPQGLGLGLIPQGGISLAMAISITLTYGGPGLDSAAVDVLFSTVVLAVVSSELVGPFLTRDLLRRSGEIRSRTGIALAASEADGIGSRARARPGTGRPHGASTEVRTDEP